MNVRIANLSDAETIAKLAREIWPRTYADIISTEQIAFMLEKSYTVTSLEKQLLEGHTFFILESDAVALGFASVTQEIEDTYKLQKFYIHQNLHKKGAGTLLLSFVEDYCRTKGAERLLLNVNRNNKAKLFYDKMGYTILHTVDIPYHDFVLNDYIMGKNL
ncbi:GNAT family N-acetyltransferase [Pedobacter arcticus]|uniref:GNAT family N-acetyltransferase n=1 Tax=Pedobacter arcticus TaxID=752140 RepID=UPI00031555A3|nr:GNAT family N-acetyltransferase [Pedobacter arcticus]